MQIKQYRYDGDGTFHLKNYTTNDTAPFTSKEEAVALMEANKKEIAVLQDRLYAESKESVLLILQAMDAAGKDSAIKHVISGINPQGVSVHNFKQPNAQELDHDYLWRAFRVLPERGNIGVFNRSYYEDVLVVRVHDLHERANLPDRCLTKNLFERRYKQISQFEQYLHDNGTRVVKIFLHLSKEEQKERFLSRIDNPEKNWKFSRSDLEERAYWDDYQDAYEDAIEATACKDAPWYIVPADKKWYARLVISQIILETLQEINPHYPELPEDTKAMLQQCRQQLLNEEK